MYKKTAKVINRLGIHARPAAMFVKHSSKFKAEVWLEKDGLKINGKSIMGVMMLAAEKGSEIIISAEGEDEQLAVDALVDLIQDGFGNLKDL